ncbi:MAG: hypothetical protein HN855_15425 [Anaerolineae bacterium]|jgi:hypothetical protein|nr:hypothetical protein [Anaerolineae bacterium]MBT7326547.1 hypothetical protein [Anaerolineae bacterium]
MTFIESYIPIFSSLIISILSFTFINGFDFSFGQSAASRVGEFAAADRRGFTDKLGDGLMDRLGLSSDSMELNMLWAKLGGMYKNKTVGSVVGQGFVFAGLGIAFMVLSSNYSVTVMGLVFLAGYYPIMSLKGDARKVREEVQRTLPESASLIAAEMMAGSSAETAVTRASVLPGSLSRMINDAVEIAQQSGSLLFSRDKIQGVLLVHLRKYQLPQLDAFASQIDLVSSRGSDGPAQMAEVVRGLAREYRSEVTKQAEALDSKLLMPITAFFFIPLLGAIFIPLGVSVLQTF